MHINQFIIDMLRIMLTTQYIDMLLTSVINIIVSVISNCDYGELLDSFYTNLL